MNTRKNNDTPICAVNGYLTPCSSDIRPYVYIALLTQQLKLQLVN